VTANHLEYDIQNKDYPLGVTYVLCDIYIFCSFDVADTLDYAYRTFAPPILCYGSEAWTIRKQDINELQLMK
jgi:hypothetical protein